jgi:cobalt-zinc-cadmium efflux system membrane fusion protein
MKHIFWFVFFIFSACQTDTHVHTAGEQAHDGHAHDTTANSTKTDENQTEHAHVVKINKAQFAQMSIVLGEVFEKTLRNEINATGTLHLPPQNRAFVSSLIAGKISRINVHEGEKVQKGQVLAYLTDMSVIILQRDYLTALQELNFKKTEADRQNLLKKSDAVAEKNVLSAQSAYEIALAQVEGMKAQLKLLGINPEKLKADNIQSEIPITAPVAGSLYGINANLGEFVQADKMLFEIYNNEHLHIEILVYEKDIYAVKEGQIVRFMPSNHSGIVKKAKVFALAQGVDTETKTFRVHAEMTDKTDDVFPGMFGEVKLGTAEENSFVLPETAVVRSGEDFLAYKVKNQNKDEYAFEEVKLKVKFVRDGFVCLTEKPENAVFATQGAYYIHATANKEEGGHSHAH